MKNAMETPYLAKRSPRRGVILAASCVTCALVGATYMWSIFSTPLGEAHSWTSAQVSLAYSLYYLFVCAASFIGGTLQRRLDARWIILIGGACYAIAWCSLALCRSLVELYIGFAVFGGMGAGFVYNTAVATATKWFPEKRGFANGLVIGSNGLAPLIFAPLGSTLVENFGIGQAPLYVGAILTAGFLVFSWMIHQPDITASSGADAVQTPAAGTNDADARQMVRTPFFWGMLAAFFTCAITGAMIMGHAAAIGVVNVGMTAAQAALQVAALAVGNFCGRLGFGYISDRFGRCETLMLCMAITLLDILVAIPAATSFIPFAGTMIVVGACYGSVMVVMPSLCADVFGSRNFGQNYSLIFIGFSAASFTGPLVAAAIVDATGSYTPAFTLAAIFALVGLGICFALHIARKRMAHPAASNAPHCAGAKASA